MDPLFEKIPASPESSFTCYIRQEQEFPFEWHYHPEYELTYILSSNGRRLVGDSVEDYGPNDLVLIGPDMPHTWQSTAPGRDGCSAVVIQFSGDFLGEGFFARSELRSISEMFGLSPRGIRFETETASAMKGTFLKLIKAQGFSKLSMLLSILDDLSRSENRRLLSGSVLRSNVRDQSRFNEVFRFMNEHLDRPVRQSEAAAIAGMSNSSFSRFFRRVSGRSFVTCLNEIRISRACSDLIETDMDITEICFSSGFRNISNFNRQFRKLKSCSPRDYRSRFREQKEK